MNICFGLEIPNPVYVLLKNSCCQYTHILHYARYINNALQKLYSRYNDYVRYVNDVSYLMILVT